MLLNAIPDYLLLCRCVVSEFQSGIFVHLDPQTGYPVCPISRGFPVCVPAILVFRDGEQFWIQSMTSGGWGQEVG